MARAYRSEYNLLKSFIIKDGNDYPVECVKSLRFWARFNPITYEDLSKNNLTGSYSGDITSTKNSVDSGEVLPIGIFPGDPAHVQVSGSPLLSFSTAESGAVPTTASDQPFSISTWVKVDHLDSHHYILTKKSVNPESTSSTGYEYYFAILSTGGVLFNLSDTTESSACFPKVNTADGAIIAGQWHHILVTYDGRGASDADDGMSIYIDGVFSVNTRTGTQSNYKGMCPNSQYPLLAGVYYQGSNELEGQMAELAMWSRCLTPGQVKAVYNATRRETTYRIGTGFLNLPPRVTTRQRDNATGSYPTIARTSGISGSLGNSLSTFDDTRVVIFQKLTSTGSALDPLGRLGGPTTSSNSFFDVRYPTSLDTYNHNRYYRNWVATPNTSASLSTSTIYAGSSGSIGPFLSTQGLKYSIDQGLPLRPFNDNAVYLGFTQFYMTGTLPSVYPGFSSPLRDKFQIKIPLGSVTESIASRYSGQSMMSDGGRSNVPPPNDSEFGYTRKFTGFLYYNFDSKRWNDVGLSYSWEGGASDLEYKMWYPDSGSQGDGWYPATANGNMQKPSLPDFAADASQRTYKSQQFGMSNHMGHYATSYSDLMQFGYSKIGAATMAGKAPFDKVYYATSSNTLELSNYLAHPILLEKAVIEIPVVIRRKQGASPYPSSIPSNSKEYMAKVLGSNRDIDNYVFFLYRQTKDPDAVIQTLEGGSAIPNSRTSYDPVAQSSKRYLICSGSVAVYNEKLFVPEINTEISASGLPHSPSVSISLSYPVSASESGTEPSSAAGVEIHYSASLRIEMTPAVPSGQYAAGSRMPTRAGWVDGGTVGPGVCGSVIVQDFWAGGTTYASSSFTAIGSSPQDPEVNFAPWTGAWMIPPGPTLTAQFMPQIVSDGTFFNFIDRVNPPGYPSALEKSESTALSPGSRPLVGDFGRRFKQETVLPFTKNTGGGISGNSRVPITFASGAANSTPSPYMLFPEDELVIGLDAGISITETSGTFFSVFPPTKKLQEGYTPNDQICLMSGSYLKIERGPATLTLFGSEVQNDHERLFELNQPLTSDAIHEALHFDNPVLDQFMIEDRSLYSGSYVDNMNMGFILARSGTIDGGWTDGFNIPFTMPRGRHGTVLGGMGNDRRKISDFFFSPVVVAGSAATVGRQAQSPAMDPNGFRFWNNNLIFTYRSTSRQQRMTTLIDFGERYFDTVMPNIQDYCERSKFITYNMHGIPTVFSQIAGAKARYVESSSMTSWNLYAWPYATEVPRQISQRVYLFGNVPSGYADSSAQFSNTTNDNLAGVFAGWFLTSSIVDTILDPVACNAILFRKGYSFGLGTTQKTGPGAASLTQYFIRMRYGGADQAPRLSGSFVFQTGQAHGHAYGIQNVRPQYTKAVFRSDRYGQFRDMMEQRRDGKFWETPGDGKMIGKDGYGENIGVIQDYFVDATDGLTLVNPYSTNCSNMDNESTSSMPYVDGVANNTSIGTFSVVDLGGMCVAEGTLILTNEGDIPVENVTQDHQVLSYDFKIKDFAYFDVLNCYSSLKDNLYDIETMGGFKLRCTGDHPLMCPSRNDWELPAKEAVPGDPVWVAKDGALLTDEIKSVLLSESPAQVYNFTIDKVHTYFSNGILSHNVEFMIGGMVGEGTSISPAFLGGGGGALSKRPLTPRKGGGGGYRVGGSSPTSVLSLLGDGSGGGSGGVIDLL